MATLLLVRHGETDSNRLERFRGLDDVPLSGRGFEQAARLAKALSRRAIGEIVTSPLLRARQTADAIAREIGLVPRVEPALADADFGDWTGRTLQEVRANWPREWETWISEPERAAFPGGGSLADVRVRASAAARALAARGQGAVAIVTHRVVLKLIVLDALGLGPEAFWRLRVDTASVSEIVWEGSPQLVRLNDTSHLGEACSCGKDF